MRLNKWSEKVKILCGIALLVPLFVLQAPEPCFSEGGKEFRKRGAERLLFTEDDIAAEIKFGKLLAAKILGKYGLYSKDARPVKYINLVGQGLARYSGRPGLVFHFAILDTENLNAFAAPGGYIFISVGSLKRMRSEAELAGVLAHEIAHVSKKHIVRDLNIRGAGSPGLSTFTSMINALAGGGSVEAVFQELSDRAAELLFEDGLKREDEFEADRLGALIAAEAGYRPAALREYLALIQSDEKNRVSIASYTKTHPSFDKRIEKLLAMEEESGMRGVEGKSVTERFLKYFSHEQWSL